MSNTSTLSPQQKSAATRAARKLFRQRYGSLSYSVARDLLQGQSTDGTAWLNDTTKRSVVTTLGNLNRPGLFSQLARACNW